MDFSFGGFMAVHEDLGGIAEEVVEWDADANEHPFNPEPVSFDDSEEADWPSQHEPTPSELDDSSVASDKASVLTGDDEVAPVSRTVFEGDEFYDSVVVDRDRSRPSEGEALVHLLNGKVCKWCRLCGHDKPGKWTHGRKQGSSFGRACGELEAAAPSPAVQRGGRGGPIKREGWIRACVRFLSSALSSIAHLLSVVLLNWHWFLVYAVTLYYLPTFIREGEQGLIWMLWQWLGTFAWFVCWVQINQV